MERGCRNPDDWSGSVGFRLGSKLYFDLSEGSTRPPDDAIDRLAAAIKKLLSARFSRRYDVVVEAHEQTMEETGL